MKKNIVCGLLILFIINIFCINALADTSYPLKTYGEGFVERYINFTIENGKITATTYATDLKSPVKLALIMSEYSGDTVVNTKVDMSTISYDHKFSLEMDFNEDSVYKAYMWNYSTLMPYTNVAAYPSSDVALKNLKFNGFDLDINSRDQKYTIISNGEFPIMTGAPVNNGTVVTVTVSEENKTITLDIVSSDGSVTDCYIIRYEDITDKFRAWLNEAGINFDAYITTYIIDGNNVEYVNTDEVVFDPTDPIIFKPTYVPETPEDENDKFYDALIEEYAPYTVIFETK